MGAAKKKAEEHDCVKLMNEARAVENSQLEEVMSFSGKELIAISVEKVDSKKKGKLRKLFATYCPFCGKKLIEE